MMPHSERHPGVEKNCKQAHNTFAYRSIEHPKRCDFICSPVYANTKVSCLHVNSLQILCRTVYAVMLQEIFHSGMD